MTPFWRETMSSLRLKLDNYSLKHELYLHTENI